MRQIDCIPRLCRPKKYPHHLAINHQFHSPSQPKSPMKKSGYKDGHIFFTWCVHLLPTEKLLLLSTYPWIKSLMQMTKEIKEFLKSKVCNYVWSPFLPLNESPFGYILNAQNAFGGHNSVYYHMCLTVNSLIFCVETEFLLWFLFLWFFWMGLSKFSATECFFNSFFAFSLNSLAADSDWK